MHYAINNPKDFFIHYKQAAWEKDIQCMINLYDQDVLIFDMWGKAFSRGLAEWSVIITDWLTSLKDEKVNVTFEMIEVQESESVAFANALIQFQAISTDGQILRSMKNRITVGFLKNNGTWSVKHQHNSAPIDGNLKALL